MTSEKITQHLHWFEEYERLREKNKVAIQQWRDSRRRENDKVNEKKTRSRKSSTASAEEAEGEQKKIEITKWKRQKEEERELQEQKLKEQKEAERLFQKIEREKQLKVREKILTVRQERQRAEESAKIERKRMEEEIRKERAEEARKMIKTYRKLDDMHVEKMKLMRITRKEKKDPPRVPEMVSIPRNPDRLLQMTEVWRAKCKIDELENKTKFPKPVIHVRNIPHLKVPEWRRGISST
ncbi:uncharacterized protein LOC132203016 [Neocloeon triangulifer]|uniref:uncharacterized protein LOC132203016 n=1 Tax=Neocloeon triangulifer TaxID=2078957 RepID=UPI00286F32A6|nr:uncharacterized protein LOC132203016 [Neocloeon triangulifer]